MSSMNLALHCHVANFFQQKHAHKFVRIRVTTCAIESKGSEEMEAQVASEPTHKGFAVLLLITWAFWAYRRAFCQWGLVDVFAIWESPSNEQRLELLRKTVLFWHGRR